jgi:hypothetical protein
MKPEDTIVRAFVLAADTAVRGEVEKALNRE